MKLNMSLVKENRNYYPVRLMSYKKDSLVVYVQYKKSDFAHIQPDEFGYNEPVREFLKEQAIEYATSKGYEIDEDYRVIPSDNLVSRIKKNL